MDRTRSLTRAVGISRPLTRCDDHKTIVYYMLVMSIFAVHMYIVFLCFLVETLFDLCSSIKDKESILHVK